MPYTVDDYHREYVTENMDRILKYLATDERLKDFVAERLRGLPVEERLKGLPAEAFLKHMPAAEIEAYVKKLRQKKRKAGKRN